MSSKSKQSTFTAVLGIFLLVTALGSVRAQSAGQFARTPLSFEANAGQTDSRVEYLSRGAGYTVFLQPGEVVVRLKAAHGSQDAALRMELEGAHAAKGEPETREETRTNYLIGSHPENWRTGVENFGRVRYRSVWPGVDVVYYGNQRRLEHDFILAPGTDVTRVRMRLEGAQSIHVDAAKGDLVLEMAGGRSVRLERPVSYQERDGRREPVESRYVLAANGRVGFTLGSYDRKRALVIDPVLAYSTYLGGSIADQVQAIAVDSTGAVYVAGVSASPDFPLVGAYQKTNKPAASSATSAFVAKVNAAGTALVWSTYLGGSGVTLPVSSYATATCGMTYTSTGSIETCGDAASGIAVDASGNVYVTGAAHSTDFPLVNAYQKTNEAAAAYATNAFVAKLNATGSALTWSTYLGGSGRAVTVSEGGDNSSVTCSVGTSTSSGSNATCGDGANAIALDASGNVYVTGQAASLNFPVVNALQAQNLEPTQTAFVTKIKADGSALMYSTYLGGSDANNAWSNYLYGVGDTSQAIAVDAAGEAYVAGLSLAADFPVVNAIQPVNNAYEFYSENGFVAKLNAAGTALTWSTYLGGTGNADDGGDGVLALTLDSSGNAYVTGYANSGDFPLVKPYQSKNLAEPMQGANAFVTKIQSNGSAIAWSTYLGGPAALEEDDDYETLGGDGGTSIALDKSGNVYVAGLTASLSFPLVGALESTNVAANHRMTNAFVSELNASGSALLFSTYWGGEGNQTDYDYGYGDNGNNLFRVYGDAAWALAVDTKANIYVGGTAQSTDFPAYKALQPGMKAGAVENGFVAKFAAGTATQPATELTLSSSNSAGILGSNVNFTAQVAQLTGTTAPTGKVAFTVDGTALGTATLSASGYASLSTSSLTVGTHQIVASYAGDTKSQTSTGEIEQTIKYPAPVFSVAGGTYATSPKVTITEKSAGLTIYYTLTEQNSYQVTPTSSSTEYTAPATIGSGGYWCLSAIAMDAKGNESPVTSVEYMTASVPPAITPGTGTYYSGTTVTLASPSGQSGNIYYTTNGTAATTSSPQYFYTAIPVTTTTTIHAIFVDSYCAGESWCSSAQTSAVITTGAAPVFSVAGGTYATPPKVTITDKTAGATIYYALSESSYSGTTPTSSSTKYTGPVTISSGGSWFLSAIAIDAKGDVSPVTSVQYMVASPVPTITPGTGTYSSGTAVKLAPPAGQYGYIYYTINGTPATTSSNSVLGSSGISLTIASTTTIHAMFVNENCTGSSWCNSAQATATITIGTTPSVKAVTQAVSIAALERAVLNGQVTSATAYWFEYGTSATALTQKTAQESVKPGSAATSVAQMLTGLKSGQQYYFHMVAANGAATSKGAVLSFNTK